MTIIFLRFKLGIANSQPFIGYLTSDGYNIMKKDFIRLDEAALLRVLKENKRMAAELIIRLAWQAGLNRPQIHALTWYQISFDPAEIRLPTHTVPIHPDLLACLKDHRNRPTSQKSEYVVLSDAHRTHLHSVRISKVASEALSKEEALKNVSLYDLRNDFIAQMLEQHGKNYTLQVSGIAVTTLYSTFSKYLSQSRGTVTEGNPSKKAAIDRDQLMDFLAAEGTSHVAMSIWLAWKQGMSLEEIVSLTWEQVDFEANTLRLADQEVSLHPVVAQLLKELHDSRSPAMDPHVILTPQSKTPFLIDRLSVVIRTALRRRGLNSIHMGALHNLDKLHETEDKIIQYIQEHRFITRNEAQTLLGISETVAWKNLNLLTQQKKLVRVGTRYYIPGTVVPPEEQPAAIIKYLKESGMSTCGDIAEMLHTEKRACAYVLHKMVEEGSIIMVGQTYKLPEETK